MANGDGTFVVDITWQATAGQGFQGQNVVVVVVMMMSLMGEVERDSDMPKGPANFTCAGSMDFRTKGLQVNASSEGNTEVLCLLIIFSNSDVEVTPSRAGRGA